ncbi:MAG: hypothetical protein A2928_01550 [Candidatus Taylorbacteria bacterium RIFCSPLOWO2_01_FULL_45_15b]|uniref:DDH domain-containing protein n=1 Tax=Candidatus Taylorbacteria bacterium RIFCSPLOWO2_01_FULL_45_15b TaxID=1802319 RepID=A0A1G2NBR1_9BACT|nr:MAG: hypothetical protein A2928_01550 [Candidatus Taylorbacteria bacterium RIFCSPLOWO2_01_FULL_45_15b]
MNIKERAERFRKIIEVNSEFHIVLAQVDPDAIGSAFALMHGISTLRPPGPASTVRIFYGGSLGHPQNRAIVNKYGLQKTMEPYSRRPEAPNAVTILVDSSNRADKRFGDNVRIEPLIIIDHHRTDEKFTEDEGKLYWIEDCGSASTLVIELLVALNISLAEMKPSSILAGLGIYSDTHNLVDATSRDRGAFAECAKGFNHQDFAELVNHPLPETYYRNLERALRDSKIDRGRLVTGLGFLTPEEADDLSTIAEQLIRREAVTMVVVWGIVNGNVRISARNDNLSQPLEGFLQKRFGPEAGAKLTPAGRGEGGALLRLPFAEWVLKPEPGAEVKRQLEESVSARVCELVFQD